MLVREYTSKPKKTSTPEKAEELVRKLRKEHEKLVKGMFEFLDAQGGWLDFSYRFFKGEPVQTFRINHGEIVEIPMGIVKHLNNCYKKVRMLDPNLPANGIRSNVTKTSRTRFTPSEFLPQVEVA